MRTGVIHCKCSKTKLPYDMAIMEDTQNGGWIATRCYPLGKTTKVYPETVETYTGGIHTAKDFNGCPHCQEGIGFVRCGACGKFSCWDGKAQEVDCPHCNTHLKITGHIKDFDSTRGN